MIWWHLHNKVILQCKNNKKNHIRKLNSLLLIISTSIKTQKQPTKTLEKWGNMVKLQVQQSQLAAVLVLQQRFEYSAHVMFRQLTAQLKCAERKSIYIKSSTFNRNLCLTCLNELRSICHNTAGIRYLTVLLNQTFVFGVDRGCSLMLHLSRFNTEQTPKICLQSSKSDSAE